MLVISSNEFLRWCF